MAELTNIANQIVNALVDREGKYLTFSLAGEEYGIGILKVKEIIGIVVDSVSEVLNIKGGDIENTRTFGARLDTGYILGMAKMNGSVKILLDIDKVLSAEEVAVLDKAA
jgi:chemotaxis signal transduction protein